MKKKEDRKKKDRRKTVVIVKDIESKKRGLVGLSVVLAIITLSLVIVGLILANVVMDERYPREILVETDFSAFTKTMPSDNYLPLREIAERIADNGNGPLLFPKKNKTTYDYEGTVLTSLTTNTGSGCFYMAQGTGNIQEDIISHINDYYIFMGKVSPSYDEKVFETGNMNNFSASYSSGYLNTGNLFKEKGFYVSAFECVATESGKFLFVAYVTEDSKELKEQLETLCKITTYALEGEQAVSGNGNDIQSGSSVDADGVDGEEEDVMSVDEINAYMKDKYGLEDGPGVPVSANSYSGVSANSVGDEISLQIVDED